MSLTSELKPPGGVVRRFLEANFPEMRGLRQQWNEAVRDIEPVAPKGPGEPPYATIGTAFDYRLRLGLDVDLGAGDLVAAIPAQVLSLAASTDGPFVAGPKGPVEHQPSLQILVERPPGSERVGNYYGVTGAAVPIGRVLPAYFSMLDDDLNRLEPAGKILAPEEEDRLNRHCYVLALLDALYRNGYSTPSPLYNIPRSATADDLLQLGADWSRDLANLYQIFWTKHRSLFDLPVTTNPGFTGSRAIHGADGDLIIDRQLIEIKTTVRKTLKRETVWQLIGYLLLDWDNEHEISGLGVYSSRFGVFMTWPLDDFLHQTSAGEPRQIPDLRDEFKSVVLERNKR